MELHSPECLRTKTQYVCHFQACHSHTEQKRQKGILTLGNFVFLKQVSIILVLDFLYALHLSVVSVQHGPFHWVIRAVLKEVNICLTKFHDIRLFLPHISLQVPFLFQKSLFFQIVLCFISLQRFISTPVEQPPVSRKSYLKEYLVVIAPTGSSR